MTLNHVNFAKNICVLMNAILFMGKNYIELYIYRFVLMWPLCLYININLLIYIYIYTVDLRMFLWSFYTQYLYCIIVLFINFIYTYIGIHRLKSVVDIKNSI